ncbi:MAG: YkvA family protein [Chloroflexi bacterium]|nr:YkvA family protein [Chloroflexota bacterium]
MARLGTRSAFVRTLNYLAFLPLASRAPSYGRLVLALLTDGRIPLSRKAILGVAVGYVASPLDLIPEAIPVIGAIDDVVVLVFALEAFLDGLPAGILQEKLVALEIDPIAFERDRAQVRRMVPRPVRRLASRLPGALRAVGTVAKHAGMDRRVRAWLSMEDA